ncbi:hypothetical protein ZHAS_00019305 [Anopheles sinensis]|uniref:Uncharacterized protein n=1 Tax=Anopheles sinensis TaxID=74873 RepID=A0A084WLQ2_ANOSI|nr:hypothetical protein ZHAS_00019305 [Anopheles sinensis]
MHLADLRGQLSSGVNIPTLLPVGGLILHPSLELAMMQTTKSLRAPICIAIDMLIIVFGDVDVEGGVLYFRCLEGM